MEKPNQKQSEARHEVRVPGRPYRRPAVASSTRFESLALACADVGPGCGGAPPS